MYKAKVNGDINVKSCPNIGDNIPLGYEKVKEYFVDNSGFGTRGEPAYTFNCFLNEVKAGYYYAITSVGQFQVYIGEFRKIARSRKEIFAEAGIVSSKIVKNNTRLTEYMDGTRVLRLHATDIIKWQGNKVILNSGGFQTHTTKQRLNQYLPGNIRVYQKDYNWYIEKDGKTSDFSDNIEIDL